MRGKKIVAANNLDRLYSCLVDARIPLILTARDDLGGTSHPIIQDDELQVMTHFPNGGFESYRLILGIFLCLF